MIGAVNSKGQPVMLSAVQQRAEEAGKRGRPQALGVLQARPVREDSCCTEQLLGAKPCAGCQGWKG